MSKQEIELKWKKDKFIRTFQKTGTCGRKRNHPRHNTPAWIQNRPAQNVCELKSMNYDRFLRVDSYLTIHRRILGTSRTLVIRNCGVDSCGISW